MFLSTRAVTPSSVVTNSDHGAVVKVTAAFCTSVSLVFLCTRLLIRWPWRELIGKDDLTICLASVRLLILLALAPLDALIDTLFRLPPLFRWLLFSAQYRQAWARCRSSYRMAQRSGQTRYVAVRERTDTLVSVTHSSADHLLQRPHLCAHNVSEPVRRCLVLLST